MKRLLLSFAVLAASATVSFGQVQNYAVGATVSDFTVTDVHGNTHQLSAITGSGKWVVIDFFFTTCPPCQSTVPYFSELHQKYGCNEGDLFCISMDTGDTDAEVLAFEATYSTVGGFAPAPAVSGDDGGGNAVNANFGPSAYPTYCLIDPTMKIRNLDIWPVSSVASFESAFASAGFSPTVMSCGLSLEENQVALNEAILFPNPASNQTTVQVNLETGADVNIDVFNLLGQKVYGTQVDAVAGQNDIILQLEELNNGHYIVSVMVGEKSMKRMNLEILK